MTYTYSNGLPFNGGLDTNLKAQKDRVKKGKCSLIIIDGIPGEGKTTLSVEVLEELKGSSIDYEKQYAMGFNDFVKKLKKCIKAGLHEIIYDEAGDYNKRGWASTLNRNLNRIFEIYRQFEIIIIMAGPSFHKYDNDLILTGVPRLLLHVYGRTESYGKYKAYGLWRMTYVKMKMSNQKVPCKHEVYNWVTPNFYGYFKDLPPDRAKKLQEISALGKSSIFEEIEISNEGYLDFRQLSNTLDRSVDWVKRKVSELGLKPVKVFKRKKYFDKGIIGVLREAVGGMQA